MVEIRSKLVTLSELFTNKRGNSKYTKAYVNKNTGEFEFTLVQLKLPLDL